MKKELIVLMIFAAVGVLTLLIEVNIYGTTGALSNEIGKIRVERVSLARDGLAQAWTNYECNQVLAELDSLLRFSATEQFFSFKGLHQQDIFFDNERRIFMALDTIQSSVSPCPDSVKTNAQSMQNALVALDGAIADKTATVCGQSDPFLKEVVAQTLESQKYDDFLRYAQQLSEVCL